MSGENQQKEQEALRATRPITIRALSILAAVAALAVTAAPVGSAHQQPFDDGAGNVVGGLTKAAPLKAGSAKAKLGGKMHLEHISIGAGKDRGWQSAKAPRPAGHGIIAILIGAKATAPPSRSVKDGLSNTVMFG